MNFILKKQKYKEAVIIIIVISLIFTLSLSFISIAYGVQAGDTGTVDSPGGYVLREKPDQYSKVIADLNHGDEVEIQGTAKDSDGDVWYKVKVLRINKVGYCFSGRIALKYKPDPEFEASLTEQGFPESYKEALRTLHAKYKNWVFRAQHTGLDWSLVVDKESKLGISLVESDCLDSWKSTNYGAFDPEKGTYTVYDSGGWVQASTPVIEYYVDPRNYLIERRMFAFFSNKYDGSINNLEAVNSVANGTFMAAGNGSPEAGYATYADLLVKVGEETNVSPSTLAAMIITEQGRSGKTDSISGNVPGYEGYYNFFNIGAYAANGKSAIENGLAYAKSKGWNSKAKSIKGGAQVYARNYVNANKYTLYLKRFNVLNGEDAVGTMQYMTSIYGASVEGAVLSSSSEAIKENQITFDIPVYENMPENICPEPTSSGDNNYHLKSLSVSGYTLTPAFGTYKRSYELVVPADVSSVKISATPYSSKAKVSGIGTIALKDKDNTARITVTAASGYTKVYTIVISKEGGVEVPEPDEETGEASTEITSSKYTFGTYVTGIPEKTTIDEFHKNATVEKGSLVVYDVNDKVVTTGNIGTAMKVRHLDENEKVISEHIVCIKGEVSGDGKINSLDSLKIQKHIVGLKSLSDAYLKAADVSGDNKVNSLDVLKVEKHIVGLSAIQ